MDLGKNRVRRTGRDLQIPWQQWQAENETFNRTVKDESKPRRPRRASLAVLYNRPAYIERRRFIIIASVFSFIFILAVFILLAYFRSTSKSQNLPSDDNTLLLNPFSPLRVELCSYMGDCSTWPVGKWKVGTVEQGAYHQIKSLKVPIGARVKLLPEAGQDGESVIVEGPKETDCVWLVCEHIRSIEVEVDLLLALDYITNVINTKNHDYSKEILYSHPASISFPAESVTLVSQFSVNRLSRFETTLTAWEGPVSVVIYLTNPHDIKSLRAHLADSLAFLTWTRANLTIVKPSYSAPPSYPINRLRNLAIHASSTDYIFTIDADFIPTRTLYSRTQNTIIPILKTATFPVAYIIPCLALIQSTVSALPHSKSALRRLFRTQKAYITDPRAGHGPTLTETTFLAHEVYNSRSYYEACYESQWEPYYIVHRNTTPFYDERFFGQGGDKQAHTLLLNAKGFHFWVDRIDWITHLAHDTENHYQDSWGAEGGFEAARDREKDVMFNYFSDYIPEIEVTYGKLARWPKGCSASAIGIYEERRGIVGSGIGF